MKDKAVILVVDDQEQNIELLEAYLLPQGYEVVKATNGKDALMLLSGNRIDLILLDVMMPEMDGFEVTRSIRRETSNRFLPIILVTALRETEDRVEGIEAGCDDFISKPVDKSELLARVRSLLKIKAYNDLLGDYRKELEFDIAKRMGELTHSSEKSKESTLETIHRLAGAAEYRDRHAAAHNRRMSRYAAFVARRMGLGDDTIENILFASGLHDLGMAGVPDSIVSKPDRLDPEERQAMMLHCAIGARILDGSDVGYLQIGASIALCHHEKWDGSGYPKGLKGIEIPIAGRIAAIADVFDALTTARPYRDALSDEMALAIVRDGKGSHFDPDVADAFFAIRDEILAAKAEWRDAPHIDIL